MLSISIDNILLIMFTYTGADPGFSFRGAQKIMRAHVQIGIKKT